METATSSEYCFFYIFYPPSRHQEEARGVNLGDFHVIWVQMNLDCHVVHCYIPVVSLQQAYETGQNGQTEPPLSKLEKFISLAYRLEFR